MNETEIIQVTKWVEGVHQSRWGYHPCSYELFRKLKQLAIKVQSADRTCHKFKRWFRKSPRNRMAYPRIRNEKGQVIGYGQPTPIPEPQIVPSLSHKVEFMRNVDINGVFHEKEVSVQFMRLTELSGQIIQSRDLARRPATSPDAVKQLSLSKEDIEGLYQEFCG